MSTLAENIETKTSKSVQLDLFINEKAILEKKERDEAEKSIKRMIRMLFYRMNEMEETILDQQKAIELLRSRA